MKHRIRATISPSPRLLRAGVLPLQCERECEGWAHIAEHLCELIRGADEVLRQGARVVIEIAPEWPE